MQMENLKLNILSRLQFSLLVLRVSNQIMCISIPHRRECLDFLRDVIIYPADGGTVRIFQGMSQGGKKRRSAPLRGNCCTVGRTLYFTELLYSIATVPHGFALTEGEMLYLQQVTVKPWHYIMELNSFEIHSAFDCCWCWRLVFHP